MVWSRWPPSAPVPHDSKGSDHELATRGRARRRLHPRTRWPALHQTPARSRGRGDQDRAPPAGDISRASYPRQGEISDYYAQQNAGKRNLSIDLNFPEAREVVGKLCDTADVIVENFRPGALAAFGLDYKSVAARNPGVVYVSISGYGQRGSWRTRMAYAPTVQAETGFTQNTLQQFGVEGDARRSDALSHADVYAGLHATIAVLAALAHRRATGEGQYVDVAMAAVLTSINERVHYDLFDIDLGAEPPILGATDCAFFTGPEGEQFVSPISLVGTDTFPSIYTRCADPIWPTIHGFAPRSCAEPTSTRCTPSSKTGSTPSIPLTRWTRNSTRPRSRPVDCVTSTSSTRPSGPRTG
jgi:CoA-transferase family III